MHHNDFILLGCVHVAICINDSKYCVLLVTVYAQNLELNISAEL